MPPWPGGRPSSWLTSSPDHFIGLEEDGRGNRQAEGLGSLEVDDQFVPHGLLNGEVPRLGSFEDLIHIGGDAPKTVKKARPIGHEPPLIHKVSYFVHGWQPVRGREV